VGDVLVFRFGVTRWIFTALALPIGGFLVFALIGSIEQYRAGGWVVMVLFFPLVALGCVWILLSMCDVVISIEGIGRVFLGIPLRPAPLRHTSGCAGSGTGSDASWASIEQGMAMVMKGGMCRVLRGRNKPMHVALAAQASAGDLSVSGRGKCFCAQRMRSAVCRRTFVHE
jgi:hypothetical protein